MSDDFNKTRVFTDKLIKKKQDWGADLSELEPVDMNGAFVAVDKYASDNLERTQENINWRLQTEPIYPFTDERKVSK